MGTSTVNLSSADVELAPPSSGGSQTPSLSSSDVEIEGAPQQQGPINPYANQPSAPLSVWQKLKGDWNEGVDTVDQAATTEPVDTGSVGGFAKSVASDLGAGATRMFFSPIAHPLKTVAGIAKMGRAAVGDTGALYDVTKGAVEPFVRNPSGEAVAALPMAALAATGLGGRAAAAEAPEEAAAAESAAEGAEGAAEPPSAGKVPPARPAPPTGPQGGSGGGGGPVEPPQAGGGGVATAVRTQVKAPTLSPADQALADRLAAEQAQGNMPPNLIDLQRRAGLANQAARKAEFELSQQLQLQRAARAHGDTPPPFDPQVAKTAQLLRAQADELSQTAQQLTAKWKQGPAGWEQSPTGPTPPHAPTPAEVGAQYIARVQSGIPPEIAAAGLGMTPQHQEAAHVAYAFVPQTTASVAGSQKPPAPPVVSPSAAPASPVATQQQAQQNTVVEAAASAQSIEKQAAQIVAGVPPPKPPEVPQPQGMADGHLSQQTINTTGQVIQSLPSALQPKAILEATGNLAKWLFDQKTAIGPDGKVVNVDSQKAAQTTAVKIINDEVDRQTEQAKATQETQQKAIQERQDNAKQAQEERDQSIAPTEKAEKPTGPEQPVEIPDTPATQKAIAALAAAPMETTSEQLDALIRRTATVTAGVRKRLVKQEIQRRANRQEDHAQAGMMGAPIAPGQSREELQRWADAVGKGEHPYVHVPANVAWKPAGVEDLARTQVKGAGPFSGTYYHAKEISPADIRKAARDKQNPQGALDALAAKWKGESPAAEQKPIELKAEDVETETVHKFGNTQADIPPDSPAGKALAALRAKIDPADLMGEGLVEDSHITVRYGIKDEEFGGIRKFVKMFEPFEATLGKTAAFPASEHSDGAVPIIVPVEAKSLRIMEKEIDQFGNFAERSFPEYRPHATVAYVKPEAAKKYTGLTEAEGKTFKVESVSISKRDGTTEEVELKGASRKPETKAAEGETKPAFKVGDLVHYESPNGMSTGVGRITDLHGDSPNATVESVNVKNGGGTGQVMSAKKSSLKPYENPSNQVAKREVPSESKEVNPAKSKATISATDSSVRDWSVRAAVKNGKVTVTSAIRGTPIKGSITFNREDWPEPKTEFEKKYQNFGKDQRDFIRDLMVKAGIASFEEEGAAQAERIADSMVSAVKKMIERESAAQESITLPPEAATGLTALVEDHAAEDPTATLDDVLRNKDTGNFIAQALVNDGIITNSADNVNPKTGLLTTSAKAKVGDALLAELLPPAVIEQTPEFLKQKLLGTMGAIKGIQSAGEGWNLQDQIVAATERYGQIFRGLDTQDQGPVVEAILKKLDDPIDKVRAAFSSFAVAATNHDPSDKPFFDFNLAFGTELTEEQFKAGLKPVEKPAETEPERIPKSPEKMFVFRDKAEPMLDIHREPTGWLKIDYENGNGTILIHPYENVVIPFKSKDEKSGTAGMRANAEAQAYAIDNPVEPKPAGPAGELIIKPIFKQKTRPEQRADLIQKYMRGGQQFADARDRAHRELPITPEEQAENDEWDKNDRANAPEFTMVQQSNAAPKRTKTEGSEPLAKGDKVTYRTNKGKERTGEVAWTDGKKVRITDNGSTVNKSIEDVSPVKTASPLPNRNSVLPNQPSKGNANLYGAAVATLAQGMSIGTPQEPLFYPERDLDVYYNDGKWSFRNASLHEAGSQGGWTVAVPDVAQEIQTAFKSGELDNERPVKAEPAADATLVDALQDAFRRGQAPKDYNGLKKIVTVFDGADPDQLRMKEAQEAFEAMVNREARDMVNLSTGGNRQIFDRLVRLYEGQPNLSIRTSTSIANQAYSTPLPLAFIADKFAGIDKQTTVYEPTAGNGALLIAANPELTLANELNPARAQTLEDEGFSVTRQDATVWGPTKRQDAVVANPPFGPLAGPVKVDGYNVVKLDHLIVAKALSAMKDAGKAAIIIAAGDRENPGEITNKVRPFFNWLYAHYNVVSDFELEGDLYSRQGASFPVRMIAIDGRVRSAKVSPDAAAIPRLKTWGEVYDKAAEHLGTNLAGQRPANNVAGGPVRDESADTGTVSRTATGRNRPIDSGEPEASPARTGSDGGTEPQPGPIAHSGRVASPRVGSPDSTVRPDGDVARSDRLAEGQPAPRTVRRGTAEPDGHSANALADESNQFQASYRPHSSKKDVAVMAPKALIDPMQTAMDRIADEVGDIDQWVTDQLGYPDVETMHEAFMGIQTDAIAAAIYQMQRGKGTVIGDQTGVGKGRVAAAMIRWAELHGHIPIFVTESAPLFSPMYADLQDIGSGQTISPLLFNADASITDPKTGTKIFQNPGAMRPVLDRIRETGELPKGRNAVFLTYSQINTENRQQLTLHRIAPNAIFILDESHNAGGDSNTGNFLSELLTGSKGVVFLSATWAKRPDNLPLYAGMTDISTAIPDRALVADAITAGGAPLQAVLTSLLAETGQFVRRERSFDGIDIKNVVDEKNEAEHTRISDKVTEVLRGIVKADALFHNLDFDRIQKEAKRKGGGAQSNKVVVQHMEFSSLVHNMVKQLLLALKADTAANEIIAAIERGEKPVFALENTMGAFLDSYIQGHNLSEGDSLAGLDYSRISDRALMRTRYYNETDPMGNKNRVEVPLDDLSPQVREAYDETQALIDALKVDLPVSPIDYIRAKVEKAGYKIAEITGRNWRIDYTGDVPKLATVPGIERKDRVNTATQFNNGGLDALIINRAGSTGISLHAGEKFRDQRPRHMIVGQPAGDVNIVMQILGRVNRTGQMVLPKYTMLAAALPAEQRPAINLAKKMKSLNANVSSNTRAATSVQAVDLMNKYGDKIVAQYLSDNPEMARLLGLKADTNEKGEPTGNEGLAMKATGHSALLPVAQQQEFMDSISEAYTNYIDFLDETGQNDLEPRTYDFAARETHIERMYQGIDPSSPFGQDAHYGEYSIKRQGKPFTPEEVMEKIADTFGPAAMQLPPRERDTLAARDVAAHFEELYKPYLAGLTHESTMERAQQMRTRGRQLLSDYRVSTGVRIELNGEQYNGVITNIEGAKKPSGNPYAPSALQFTIAVNSGLRQTKVPGSQMDALVTSNLGRNADVRQLFKDYGSDRQKAKIITGNLLGAYGELKTGAKGRIISFTMDDGTSKLGILMPSKFDIKEDVSGTYAMRTPEGAQSFLETGDNYLQSSGSEISVVGPSNRREGYEIRTKTSKSAAGKFFLDPKLLDTVQGGEFASSNGLMKATIKEGREMDALKAIMGKISLYANPEHIEEARKHDEKAKEELDKPKVPKRAKGSVTMSFLGMGALDPLATKLLQPVVDYTKKAAVATWKEATSAVKMTGTSAKAMGHEVAAAFAPGLVADTDALDIMGKALGEPALRLFEAGQFLHSINQMLDSLSPEERIEFVDRWQTGKEQPTQDLQNAQEFMQEVLSQQRLREQTAINLGKRKGHEVELSDKTNYFPNRYKVAPGGEKALTEDQQIARLGQVSRRPFEGSKAFMKQQRYTLKEAVADGAVPLGNPVEMLLRRLQEGAKFVAARYAWYNFKDQGLAMFLKGSKKLPKDYAYVDDKSGNVWRMVQSVDGDTFPVQTGRWIIQKDAARLLNNYLSIDHIKGSEVLSAFVKLKNFSTEMKLAISAFHWAYITVENMASVLNTGMDKVVNQGIRGLDPTKVSAGLADIGKSMVAPYTAIKRGGQIIQYARNPDEFLESPEGQKFAERYPDFPHLMELLFAGGLRWNIAQQFQGSFGDHCLDAWKDGEIGKGLAKLLPWLSHGMMTPLFNHYIPRSKWAFAVELLSTKLAQYSYAIASGEKTEEEIAREVAQTTDNRFGELNWDSLYLNNDLKSAMQFFFRSATWAIGSWRGAAQAVKEQTSSKMFDDKMFEKMDAQAKKGNWLSQARRATSRLPQLGVNAGWILSMALLTSTLGSVTEKLATDKFPWEWAQQDAENNGMSVGANAALEAMHPRTGPLDAHGEPVRMSWPTGLKDYEHGYENPGRYAKGKVSDVAVNAWNTAMNRTYQGDYIFNPNDPFYVQMWQGLKYNAVGDLTPMSADNWLRTYGPQDPASKAERFTGLIGGAPKSLDRSHALSQALELRDVAHPHTPLTPEQQAERAYSQENPTKHSIRAAARARNLDYLERIFKYQLSYTDAKSVYDDPKTTAAERKELKPFLDKKRIDTIKSARRK